MRSEDKSGFVCSERPFRGRDRHTMHWHTSPDDQSIELPCIHCWESQDETTGKLYTVRYSWISNIGETLVWKEPQRSLDHVGECKFVLVLYCYLITSQKFRCKFHKQEVKA